MTADIPDNERELEALARLADGSLPAAERAELEERVAASPRLQALLAEQQRAVAAIGARREQAPPGLRAWLDDATRRPARRRPLVAAGAAAGAVAVLLALLLVVFAGETSAPTVAEAAALATRPATGAAPRPYDHVQSLLDVEVSGLAYPNWRRFGWKAVGTRADHLDGRATKTVFYEKAGRRVGYTIVSNSVLRAPHSASRFLRNGTELWALELGPRTVVTWRRKGHTCVLSGHGVDRGTLLALGSWKAAGRLPY
jgi:hypothetical protein